MNATVHPIRLAVGEPARPAGAVCRIHDNNHLGLVIASLRAAGVRGLRLEVHGLHRWLVRVEPAHEQPLDYALAAEGERETPPPWWLLIALAGEVALVVTLLAWVAS